MYNGLDYTSDLPASERAGSLAYASSDLVYVTPVRHEPPSLQSLLEELCEGNGFPWPPKGFESKVEAAAPRSERVRPGTTAPNPPTRPPIVIWRYLGP